MTSVQMAIHDLRIHVSFGKTWLVHLSPRIHANIKDKFVKINEN